MEYRRMVVAVHHYMLFHFSSLAHCVPCNGVHNRASAYRSEAAEEFQLRHGKRRDVHFWHGNVRKHIPAASVSAERVKLYGTASRCSVPSGGDRAGDNVADSRIHFG